jgi:hypothetical protein
MPWSILPFSCFFLPGQVISCESGKSLRILIGFFAGLKS